MAFTDVLSQPLPSQVTTESTEVAENNENTEFDANAMLESIEEEIKEEDGAVTEESSEDTFNAEAVLESIEESIQESLDPEPAADVDVASEEAEAPAEDTTEDEAEDVADAVVADDEEEEFDIDDLSDDELAALDAELSGEEIKAVAADGEDVPEETLTPEEEIKADDMMKVAATTMLVNDELNAEERASFLQDEAEVNTAINEGFLSEAVVNQMMVNDELVTEAKYGNKMIIKLDAASKKKQLYALAVNVSAAAHNDKDYIKYKKLMKMKKILRARMNQKYKAEATKRMRVYFARLNKSGSKVLKNVADKNK